MTTLSHGNEIVAPSASDTEVARASSRALAPHVGEASLRIQVKDGTDSEELVLPPPAARLLLDILTEMGEGNAVAVSPVRAELTTTQAAELLNVSRPYLTKLLDDGVLPFRKVGTHHRVRLADVLAYKREAYTLRRAALAELTALSQELGLYDDPVK